MVAWVMFRFILPLIIALPCTAMGQARSLKKPGIKSLTIRLEKPRDESRTTQIRVIDRGLNKTTTIELREVKSGKWWGGTYSVESTADQGREVDLQFIRSYSKEVYPLLFSSVADKRVVLLFQSQDSADTFFKANARKKVQVKRPKPVIEEKNSTQELNELELKAAEARALDLKNFEGLSQAERESRSREALTLLNSANELYSKLQYDGAAENYAKAKALDPTSDEAYYKYGVSLYKTEKYLESIAMLSVGEAGASSRVERDYYLALNHLKLKETGRALDLFHNVKDENDSDISPMAAFLAGNILLQQQKYKDAKADFEFVLDTSKSPELDVEAEKLIDEINRIESFLASQKEYLRYSIFTGISYDENILNFAESDQPLGASGYRGSYGVSFLGKIYQTYKSDLSLQLAFSDIYTWDTQFKPSRTLQTADPQALSISLPFRTQFQLGQNQWVWSVQPATTSVVMDVDATRRRRILQSGTLDTDLAFSWSPSWLSAMRLQVNQDTSFMESAEDDNQSSLRTRVGTTQTKIIDPKFGKTLGFDLDFAKTAARGKNNTNNRWDTALTYGFPLGWGELQSNLKVGFASLKYPHNPNQRDDAITSFGIGTAKTFKSGLGISLSLQHLKNSSNVTNYTYDKTLVSTLLTYTGSFSRK